MHGATASAPRRGQIDRPRHRPAPRRPAARSAVAVVGRKAGIGHDHAHVVWRTPCRLAMIIGFASGAGSGPSCRSRNGFRIRSSPIRASGPPADPRQAPPGWCRVRSRSKDSPVPPADAAAGGCSSCSRGMSSCVPMRQRIDLRCLPSRARSKNSQRRARAGLVALAPGDPAVEVRQRLAPAASVLRSAQQASGSVRCSSAIGIARADVLPSGAAMRTSLSPAARPARVCRPASPQTASACR